MQRPSPGRTLQPGLRRADASVTIPAINKTIAIAGILVWTLVVTILRAVRFPNDFAEAHWLLDYRFGFVKRGLVGSLVSTMTGAVGALPTETLVAVLSGVAFVLFGLVLLAMALRIIERSGWSATAVLAAVVFFSSPFVVMSAHLVGYFDNIVIVLAVVSIALLLRERIWAAALVQATAVFIHESSLLIGFPAFCLAWLAIGSKRRGQGRPWLPVLPMMVPLGAFAVISIASSLFAPPDFEASFAKRLAGFAFIQDNRADLVPRWLTITFAEYFTLEGPRFLDRLTSTSMYGLVLPSMLALVCATFDAWRIRLFSLTSIVLLGVCLVPQLLHAVAVDTPRIWTYSILAAFVALWVCAEVAGVNDVQDGRGSPGRGLEILLLAALVTNVVTLTPLMDREEDRFSLTLRALLYAPVIAAMLALVHTKGRPV